MVNQPTGGVVNGANLPVHPVHVDAAGTHTVITELQGDIPTLIHTSRDNAPPTAQEIALVIGAVGMPDTTRVVCVARAPFFTPYITNAQATHFDAEVLTTLINGVNTQWTMTMWYW